ncbi:sporulation integral membrane protein YlbJ [Niallia sp. NCCP-28]|uniref:sporulation integral membrane protein YlbJ n=1 Tax=Niallia sp. NCCP-28 TaxID=2934712 RepID=UPI00207F8921|nr:sporulation integral membrane protein YlbJ [Niallia sp. NCCP-28]GKU82363.1 sporulation integral membrane protein YlbJ [Niallia sp. NCCP-28]
MYRSKIKTILLALSASLLAFALIAFPAVAVDASKKGLNTWWTIVFPSLLPFLILSEIMIGFGVVRFLGVLLEPLMRPLFRVPGVGGFVWAMGMVSGFPTGAKLTARLREEKQLTKIEAERLASFSNASNPMFIIGAVSAAFFHNPKLGFLLAFAHYLANFTVGICMRFYGSKDEKKKTEKIRRPSLRKALTELHRTRLKDKRPIGKLLGDAVSSSIQSLLMVGGFIILFSVINRLLFHLHITSFFAQFLQSFFQLFHFPADLSIPFIAGIFEITLGSKLTSDAESATLMHKAIITSFILGFSGLSVQAQVASILAQTDIRFKPFFFARILQALFACLYTFLSWDFFAKHFFTSEKPAMAVPDLLGDSSSFIQTAFEKLSTFGPVFTIGCLLFYCFILLGRMKNRTI